MRTQKIFLCLATAIALVAFLLSQLYVRFFTDTTPPTITMEEETITVSVNDGTDALLQGVSAYDANDGDLTDAVSVRDVALLTGYNTAQVSYVVFDSADNMAIASRTVCYSDYQAPSFSVIEPLTFEIGEPISLVGKVFANDVLEGDLTGSIRLSAMSVDNMVEGTYHIRLRVTNRMGDSSTVLLPVIVRNQRSNSLTLRLTKYLTYLQRGEEFRPEDYFSSLGFGDGENGSFSQLTVINQVDAQQVGTYEVTYRYTDADGTNTDAILTVVVEDTEERK